MIQDDHDKHTRILTKGEGGKLDNRRVSIVLTEYFPASLYYGLPDGEERFKERVKQIFEELHLGSPFQADLGDVMGGTYIHPLPVGTYNHYIEAQLYGLMSRDGGTRKHAGVDLSGQVNLPVFASNAGVVVRVVDGHAEGAKNAPPEGNNILIEHPDGLATHYLHLEKDSIVVEEGQEVQKGQLLGGVGNTGASGGAHLHINYCAPPDSSDLVEDGGGLNPGLGTGTYSCDSDHTINPEMNPINLDLGYQTEHRNSEMANKWVSEFVHNMRDKAKDGEIFIIPGAETLGDFAASCETNGCQPPPKFDMCVNNYPTDPGGLSCGGFQIATLQRYDGTMKSFLHFLKKHNKEFYDRLNKYDFLQEEEKYVETWKEIYDENPNEFRNLQFQFIYETHYVEIAGKVKEYAGFDPMSKSIPLQEIIFAAAVQMRHNVYNGPDSVLKLGGLDPILPDIDDKSDKEIAEMFMEGRRKKLTGGDPNHSLSRRMDAEDEYVQRMFGDGEGATSQRSEFKYVDVDEYLITRSELLEKYAEKNKNLDRSKGYDPTPENR